MAAAAQEGGGARRKGTAPAPARATRKGAPKARGDTRTRILDSAERLVQVRGFNGFSYADIARELALRKASLHHHFAGKVELGEALIGRYAERFAQALAAIDARDEDAPAKLEAYASLYGDVLRERRMCLCGMLAAEYETLAPPIRAAVIAFLDDNEEWLARVLEQGRERGSLGFEGAAPETARSILGGLEGAMLTTRPYGEVKRFEAAAARLLASLAPRSPR